MCKLDKLFVLSLHLFLLLLINENFTVAYQKTDTHNVSKRTELDFCLERFDIHGNTIIRTEESKSMGAKFIDDADVLTNSECLKLCCETENCDVFIFEEKNPGSCFLFHCGMPDDFRCKFTSHMNYTSGVLTIPRRDLEATNPPSSQRQLVNKISILSQHELELNNLRRPSNSNHLRDALVVSTTTTTMSPPVGSNNIQTTTATAKVAKSTCGRFQFQCQVSGECIAIYNACDGIPQCEDGSDEGPECPSSVTTKSPLIQSIPNGIENQVNPKSDSHQPGALLQSQISHPQIIHNREDPLTAPKWPQSHVSQYMDTDTDSSHIFNHKGGIQLIPNSNTNNNNNNYGGQLSSNYQHDPYLNNVNKQPFEAPQPAIQQLDQQQWPRVRNDWPHLQEEYAPQIKPKENQANWPQDAFPDTPKGEKEEPENKHSVKKQHNDKESSEEYTDGEDQEDEMKTTEAPKKKPHKHKKKKQKDKHHEKSEDEQLKQLKEVNGFDDVYIKYLDHDGYSERPGGAVLSLTLGVIILAAVSILITCRMRKVGRRIRRHGKMHADPDFLVNGMYL